MDKVSDLVRQRAAAFDRFKALADQETLSNEERKSYAAEKEAVIALDDRITRAREAQAAAAATAQPVEGQQRAVPAAAKTDRYEKEPSLVIGGVVKMLGIGGGNIYAARQAATDLYGEAHPVTRALVVSVGSSGGFIVPPDYVAEIIELLRPRAQVRSAGELAKRQSRNHVQKAEQPMDLVPGIAGQPFIGALAGHGGLVAALVNLAGQKQ